MSFKKTLKTIDMLGAELSPNGGKSLKDSINRLDRSIDLIQARYRTAAFFSSSAAFETDEAGRCVWVSKHYCELLDCQADQAIKFGWIDLVVPEDRADVVRQWRGAVADSRACTIRFRASVNGIVEQFESRAFPLIGSMQNLIGYIGTIKKIKSDSEPGLFENKENI